MNLSIIVPVYNMVSDGKLVNCLDSLLKQDLADYEIIAVDDKSTDNSLEVLFEYRDRYPEKVRVIASPQNGRQGAAKNLGLNVASGKWVGFIDSDDWVTNDMFSSLIKKADETGADIVGCDYLITDTIGKEEGLAVQNNTSEQTGLLSDEQYKRIILQPGSMVIKIYKRSLFEDYHIRFPEKIFYEDNAVGCLPLLYASRFERVERPLYFYYQHNSSTVHHVSIAKCEDRMKASEIYLQSLKERGFYEKYKSEIDYKVYELGYKNTLFSYMQTSKWPKYSFVANMQRFLKNNVPEYSTNPYFLEKVDAENQKLTHMHQKSPLFFICYYLLLHFYRKLRYRKK